MRDRFPIATTPTERRLAREARSARMREQALALRRIGATYAAIGRMLSVCLERARRITLQAERLANAPRWYDSLPARALNFLRNHKLDGLPEVDAARAVAQLSRRELIRAPNFGTVACAAVVAWLARHGLELQPESPRLIRNETSASVGRRSSDSNDEEDPLAAGPSNEGLTPCVYPPASD